MRMNPFVAAGILEAAHRFGLLPDMKESTHHALLAGLVGYGLGDHGRDAEKAALRRSEYERHMEALRAQEQRVRDQMEQLRAQQRAESEQQMQRILQAAAEAHQASK